VIVFFIRRPRNLSRTHGAELPQRRPQPSSGAAKYVTAGVPIEGAVMKAA
jgi:hypothetical protein